MNDFIGADGWPCEFAMSGFGAKLIQAIWAIPGAEPLTEDDVEGKARMLYAVSEGGRDEELPRNRPASQKASEGELRKLAALAERLERHILSMRQPAVSAFYAETARGGRGLFELVRTLQETQDNARHAFSALEVESTPSGAPKKIEAAEVAFLSSRLFEHISGRRATFTTDPLTGKVSGAWPDFLSAVFDALYIDASVAAQVRAISEKTPR
ncbi:hypothetical protein [Roseovarius salis]|uniref:hypothetical protein n=1 Tax=Roseovarius salis TaxID=3376063 RepID=UPI0037C7B90A